MKRKVGFWRWLLDSAINFIENLPKEFIDFVRDPVGEMFLGVGVMVLGLFLMPLLTLFFVEGNPLRFAAIIYVGFLFGFAFFVVSHGIYRDNVE